MSQKMVKCEESSWVIAPVLRYRHGIITCSRIEKSDHSGLPEGTDLNRIGRSDFTLVFINRKDMIGLHGWGLVQ